MLEICFFIFLVLLFYGVGRAFLYLIRWKDSEFLFTFSSCIGVILVTIAVTWYYRLGGRLNRFFWIVSIMIGSFLLWRLIRQTKILELITNARVELLALVGFSALAILPGILGGGQFVIFRGNHWDSFNYLEAAITYQGLSYAQVDHLNAAELVSHGLFQFGHKNLLYRPEITFLYGMLSSFHLEAFLRLHYFLLVYFQFLAFCAVRALATELLPGRRIMPFLFAGAVVGGFWGQYILDMDAWSQSSCMPLIVLSLLLLIKLAQAAGPIERSPGTLNLLVLYALTWVGMFYLYPEAAIFVLPAHALCWIVAICFFNMRVSWLSVGLTAISAAGLLLPVTYSNLIPEVLAIKSIDLHKPTLWTYTQAFLFGHGGINSDLFSKGADLIAGALGIYFVTPGSGTEPLMALVIRALVVLGAGALVLRLASQARSLFSPSWLLLTVHVGVSLLLILAFCLLRDYWFAGKALSYIAYLLLLLLIASPYRTIASDQNFLDRIAIDVATVFLFLQLAFFFYRPVASRSAFGIHYSAPYPAIQDPNLKKTINFADWSFLRHVERTDKIRVRVEDPWSQLFARILLRTHRINFCLEGPAFDSASLASVVPMPPCPEATVSLSAAKATKGPFLLRLVLQRTAIPP
jgi:hypothetical protein